MDNHSADEFDDFVRSCSDRLLRSAYLLTGDQHLAEDLVQSALVRTHRAWSRLWRTSNAEAYTRRTMYHLQVAWWRRRRFTERPGDEVAYHEPAVTDSSEDIARRLVLRRARARLAPRQRAVIVLRFYEDLSVTQTAEVLHCNEGTVKSQTAKAMRVLRDQGSDLTELVEGGARDLSV